MAENETKNKTVSLDDVTKQVENMLAKAREEADRIIAEAKSSISAGAQPTEEQKKATAEREAYWNELVPVQLFKDNNKYKDDVFISVNGETCLIQRGPSASESDEQIIKKSADIWIFPYIALMTGMRKGEILALQWKDIDFENNIISVTKSVCHNGDRPIIKAPKTEESTRYVPLLLPLREKLLGYHNKHPESFIVSDDGTSPLSNRRFITLSKKFKEATGTTCTAHELRHSFATVAIENDIPPKVVQEILGHKQLSTTMDIYADLRKKSIIAAADKLNKMVE